MYDALNANSISSREAIVEPWGKLLSATGANGIQFTIQVRLPLKLASANDGKNVM